ncbi:MAG TPA: HIT domain-containing protein [Burkholderiales bacterium]|nr:HIT domain-containing protein [Burkholderiales bacterium]
MREMTDLDEAGRSRLMRDVFAVEAALRECLNLDGINLASFGNLVPHLHWHPPLRRRPAFLVGVDRPPSGRRPGDPVDPARPTAALVSRL